MSKEIIIGTLDFACYMRWCMVFQCYLPLRFVKVKYEIKEPEKSRIKKAKF